MSIFTTRLLNNLIKFVEKRKNHIGDRSWNFNYGVWFGSNEGLEF